MTTQLTTTVQVPATALMLEDVFSYAEYTLHGIKSWHEVAKLGSKNLGALVSKAREHEKSLSGSIAQLKEKLAKISLASIYKSKVIKLLRGTF